MADTPVAPPLPDGSVDFDKIHAAARQGHNLEKAIADAAFVHPDKIEAEKQAAEATATQADPEPKASKAASSKES
jgi:hypothetical protein